MIEKEGFYVVHRAMFRFGITRATQLYQEHKCKSSLHLTVLLLPRLHLFRAVDADSVVHLRVAVAGRC